MLPTASYPTSTSLERLFHPKSIAIVGGKSALEAIEQCLKLGYAGEIWPVHPSHTTMAGLTCYSDIASLPAAPDACFVAVPAVATIEVVAELAKKGAGGVICYASGFSEIGVLGQERQKQLVDAANGMPLLGPNCYGMINYLDGFALWPDQHGGQRVSEGVAIITQSGNIGLNLTMQTRGLPLAYMITVGNKAGVDFPAMIEALLEDPKITAIGMHIEGLSDVASFSKAALKALKKGIPLVALKSGSSSKGAQITMSHTSSLSGSDQLYDALFQRFGIARVHNPSSLIETLKFLHVSARRGPLKAATISSASCSGGEASLVADLAQRHGLEMPDLPPPVEKELIEILGEKVNVANPLDYHTYIWGDFSASTAAFTGLLKTNFAVHLLILDYPRLDRCKADSWEITLSAYIQAAKNTGQMACIVSSMPEGLPEDLTARLMQEGLAPMMGIEECIEAIACAVKISQAQHRADQIQSLNPLTSQITNNSSVVHTWNEVQSKNALGSIGLPIPKSLCISRKQALQLADQLASQETQPGSVPSLSQSGLKFPLVVKAVSSQLAHKTEAGAVQLNIKNANELKAALNQMADLSDQFLIEAMAQNIVAELIVGIHQDPQFGPSLTIGAGGVLVEILKDSRTLLLPTNANEVEAALISLRMAPLLKGYRGKPSASLPELVKAILIIAEFAQTNSSHLQELDVNPLMALADNSSQELSSPSVVAVDALIRSTQIAPST